VFGSRLFKILLVPVLALSITVLTGLLPLGYDSADGRQGFPIPWVNSGSSCRSIDLVYVCGANLTSYNWWILGLDSLLCAGIGYVILFVPRMRNNGPLIGLSTPYLGFFTTLAVIFVNPHSLPLADFIWGSLQAGDFGSFADTITILVEWYMMTLLAFIAIFLAEMIGDNLSHRRSSRLSLPALGQASST